MDEVVQRFIADEGDGEPLSYERWGAVTRGFTPLQRLDLLRELPQPFAWEFLGPIHPNDRDL